MTRRTILMYHRIAEDPEDPYSLCVSPDRFDAQLQTISEVAEIVDFDRLTARIAGRRSYRASGRERRSRAQVALTFDDGYADNVLAAYPVIEALGVPMTVYVTTGSLGSPKGYWWDRLALLLHGRREVDLDLEIAGRRLHISLRGENAASTALVALHTRLRLQAVAEIEAALTDIAGQLSASMPEPKRARVMTRDELRTLAASPLVTIGAHTVDHVLLAGRPLSEQIETMARSKTELESLLGRPVRHLAYPYGDGETFDAVSVEAARQCGFETACTTLAGRVTRLNDRLRLPRQMVRNWDADEIADRLWAWRAG
ncbi:MAG: polysaccharide deacetylase family protein [Acidimicrobiales bacterium]